MAGKELVTNDCPDQETEGQEDGHDSELKHGNALADAGGRQNGNRDAVLKGNVDGNQGVIGCDAERKNEL